MAREQRRAALRRRRQIAAAGVIGAAALLAPQAQAASFQVLNTNDSGAGSLRDAVNQANTAGTDDDITFAPGVAGLIRLTTGEIGISANQGLTITGPGRDVLAVSGDADSSGTANAGDSRIFHLTLPSGSRGIGVTISGLTLTRGFEPGGGNGGAIVNDTGSLLTLDDAAITDSKSLNNGGGIYGQGDLAIARSTLSGNVASSGGALDQTATTYGPGSATITDSVIAGNQASNIGGGIYSAGKYMTIERSTVSGNTATNSGGGLASQSKYGLTVKNSSFASNAAETGGGMSIDAGFVKYAAARLTETTVSGNQGIHGAGIQVSGVSSGSKVIFARSTISGNTGGADSWGGGILVDTTVRGNLELLDSTVSGNTATAGGGVSLGADHNNQLIGSYNDRVGSIDFDNSTIAGNTATAHGGGIYLSQYDSGSPSVKKSGSANITSTIVADNTAAGAPQDLDRVDTSTDGGFNGAFSLVEAPGDAPLTQQSMLVGVDPQLGSLGDHGGPTATMVPAGTSPVVDQGRSAEKLKVDQRNLDRLVDTGIANPSPGGDGTDIGSVELPADQVVLPPPPPKATFAVTVRGTSISPGTPLLPASLVPFDCTVTVVSMTSCSIELRAVKSAKLNKKTTIPKNALLAEGVATSGPGTTQLSVKVKLTRDGKDVLKAQPVGVDTIVGAAAGTDATSALTAKGVVHLLAGPTVTLGLGKRTTKLPKTANKRLDQLAKLILDAKTVSCTAYSDKGKGDVTLTKTQAKAACNRLVKDGVKGKLTSTGKGHTKPVASNKTKRGRALNRRIVIRFTL